MLIKPTARRRILLRYARHGRVPPRPMEPNKIDRRMSAPMFEGRFPIQSMMTLETPSRGEVRSVGCGGRGPFQLYSSCAPQAARRPDHD